MPFVYVQSGPVGGGGGDEVPPWAMPEDATIGRIEVKWGDYLNQLLFHYVSPSSGQGVISLGGYTSGSARADIALESAEEIVAIGGKCGSYVDSIVIVTSLKQYGPFGGPGGSSFAPFDVPRNARFAGLFGRAGMWTDSLGVVYAVAVPTEPIA